MNRERGSKYFAEHNGCRGRPGRDGPGGTGDCALSDEATGVEDRLERAVREAAREGRLPCARALELARELKVPPLRVGEAADRLGIKIVACQLGCFR